MRLATFMAAAVGLALWIQASRAQTNNNTYPIDLPAVLRLAGAQNLDIQVARARLREAEANRSAALEQFFPWVSPGVQYHRRDGLAQAVPAGTISPAHFESYTPGATVGAQVALGDAIYAALAAKQLVKASSAALETERQDAVATAAQRYFDLLKSKSLAAVVTEAVRISSAYKQELQTAVGAGIAFKGDELRVQTQTERYQISLRQAREQQRVAAATLAQVLHLDPAIELVPQENELTRITLFSTHAALDALVQTALASRPEMKQTQALLAASRTSKDSAIYGALIPSLGGQVYVGGLGGGADHDPQTFGSEKDYLVGLNWRVGPGGLFDFSRINASKARLAATELGEARLRDVITLEVVSALTRMQSLADQIELTQANLTTASEALRLTQERKQYGVGAVLEDIQSQQDLTQARSDYVNAVAEYNKAQYSLSKAVGGGAPHR